VLVVVAAAVLAMVAALSSKGVPGLRGATPSRPAATSAAPSPGTGTSTNGRNGQQSAAALEDFVREYYALLPDQPERAWSMLGDAARTESNGYQSYVNFYNSLDSVGFAEAPVAVDGQTVRATLRFVPKNGGASVEHYRFIVVPGPDGKLVMSSFSRG
jgi:hypothetical protein